MVVEDLLSGSGKGFALEYYTFMMRCQMDLKEAFGVSVDHLHKVAQVADTLSID